MGSLLFVMFMLVLVACIVYGIYLVVRIARIYSRMRGLNLQRDYETMLYAALPTVGLDEVAGLVPAGVDRDLLAEVLERMGRDTEGELKEKVVRLYRELGFYDRRLRETETGQAGQARGGAGDAGRHGPRGGSRRRGGLRPVPELPEVETIRRDLASSIEGEKVRGCEVYLPRLITCPGCDEYCARLKGARIEAVGRRGKYLIFSLDRPWEWIVHLGMTGALLLDEEGSPEPKHTHIVLRLTRPRILRYVDPRTFGESAVVPAGDYSALKGLKSMGPEPLERSFTVRALARALATGAKVKPALMDQRRVAGIGNIYADEILFRARHRPGAPGQHPGPMRSWRGCTGPSSRCCGRRWRSGALPWSTTWTLPAGPAPSSSPTWSTGARGSPAPSAASPSAAGSSAAAPATGAPAARQ